MGSAAKKAVVRYRARARRRGLVRIEVQVPKQDAEPFRLVASLLRGHDSTLADRARRELLELSQAARATPHLKELLANAPLEDIDIKRLRDFGRKVELG